jgi:hypothetical protein
MISVTLRILAPSTTNLREHWAKRAKRAKGQRLAARLALLPYARELRALAALGGVIRAELVRVSPRTLDSDNLQGALKAVRDGVADALGLDDGSARYRWEYSQSKGQPSVLITIAAQG